MPYFFSALVLMLPLSTVLLPHLFKSYVSIKTQIKVYHLHHFFFDIIAYNFLPLVSLLFQHYSINYSYNNLYYIIMFLYVLSLSIIVQVAKGRTTSLHHHLRLYNTIINIIYISMCLLTKLIKWVLKVLVWFHYVNVHYWQKFGKNPPRNKTFNF